MGKDRKRKVEEVTTPYNFVSLSEKVIERYEKKEDLPPHNKIFGEQEKRFSGDISFEIEAMSDICVGGSDSSEFYKDAEGRPAIPGASLRGLFRTNMQILGCSGVGDDIEDFRLMYRKVGEKKDKLVTTYHNILGVGQTGSKNKEKTTICKNVKAGYIKKIGNTYHLYCNKGTGLSPSGPDFFTVRETEIVDCEKKGAKNFHFFFDNEKIKLQYKGLQADFQDEYTGKCKTCNIKCKERDKKKVMYTERGWMITCPSCQDKIVAKKHIVGNTNDEYVPYYMEVSYKAENHKITAIGRPEQFDSKGYVLSSGSMNEKKVLYVIPEIDSHLHSIPQDDIHSFQIDYENKKNQLGTTAINKIMNTAKKNELLNRCQNFFKLPEEGDIKPVFYIKHKDKYYFGFTQFLRLFYDNSILSGVSSAHKEFVYDYVRSLFGYCKKGLSGKDSESYKGRIFCEDAKLISEAAGGKTSLVLAAPKPSSYLDYLVQEETETTYNTKNFKIRGIKQYWMKHGISVQKSENRKISTRLSYLKKGTKFKGKVRFKNLAKDEIGLLLWCIRLNEESQQNIGKGKPYGFGRIQVENMSLRLLDVEKLYDLEKIHFQPYKNLNSKQKIQNYIDYYKLYVKNNFNILLEKEEHIKEFFILKNAKIIPSSEKTKYVSINNYQGRKKALPHPAEIVYEKENKKDKNGHKGKKPDDKKGRLTSKMDIGKIDVTTLPKE